MPKLVASCSTPVMDGMVVKNKTSEKVHDNRGGVVEFLLINHPLDCPICDQAGECHLQDLGFEHGGQGTRYEEERRTFEPEDIGDKIKLHMNRCILCYRCVYTANQLTDQRVHGAGGDHQGQHRDPRRAGQRAACSGTHGRRRYQWHPTQPRPDVSVSAHDGRDSCTASYRITTTARARRRW